MTAILIELIIADCAALIAILHFSRGNCHFGWAFVVAALFGAASAGLILTLGYSRLNVGLMIKRGHVTSVQHMRPLGNTYWPAHSASALDRGHVSRAHVATPLTVSPPSHTIPTLPLQSLT